MGGGLEGWGQAVFGEGLGGLRTDAGNFGVAVLQRFGIDDF